MDSKTYPPNQIPLPPKPTPAQSVFDDQPRYEITPPGNQPIYVLARDFPGSEVYIKIKEYEDLINGFKDKSDDQSKVAVQIWRDALAVWEEGNKNVRYRFGREQYYVINNDDTITLPRGEVVEQTTELIEGVTDSEATQTGLELGTSISAGYSVFSAEINAKWHLDRNHSVEVTSQQRTSKIKTWGPYSEKTIIIAWQLVDNFYIEREVVGGATPTRVSELHVHKLPLVINTYPPDLNEN